MTGMKIALFSLICLIAILSLAIPVSATTSMTSGDEANITFVLIDNGITHKTIQAEIYGNEYIDDFKVNNVKGGSP